MSREGQFLTNQNFRGFWSQLQLANKNQRHSISLDIIVLGSFLAHLWLTKYRRFIKLNHLKLQIIFTYPPGSYRIHDLHFTLSIKADFIVVFDYT